MNLNVAILDLQPDWLVTQVYPNTPGAYFVPIDPGREEYFPLEAGLPSGYKEGKDIIKIFATTEEIGHNSTAHPLLKLLRAISAKESITNDLVDSFYANTQWMTSQLEVKVRRI